MGNSSFLKGLGVALATPFIDNDNTDIDYDAFASLVKHVASGGADFLVVLGSTGEAATIGDDERKTLIREAISEAHGVPVVVGTGHNSTRKTIAFCENAASLGADGVLVVTPYYNKPQPEGLCAHYSAVARAIPGIPIIVYNVPGRTGLNLVPSTLSRLWEIEGVYAVKESSGNLAQIGEIARTLPEGKTLLSGDDALALPSIALGASGLISVAGNILPRETKTLIDYAVEGASDKARQAHYALLPVMDALFAETNPAPLKAALEMAGISSCAVRLPLAKASSATRERLERVLEPFVKNGAFAYEDL